MVSNNIQVIALTGLARSGKTTIAEILERNHDFHRIRFAKPLKDMLKTLGLTHEELEGDLKEAPSERLCGRTPRWAMQSLGTEWGRDLIHPDLWVAAWKKQVDISARRMELYSPEPFKCVVEDCRFPNEEKAVRAFSGSKIWRVVRPGAGVPRPVQHHVSEFYQPEADAVIHNTNSVGVLELLIEELLKAKPVSRI